MTMGKGTIYLLVILLLWGGGGNPAKALLYQGQMIGESHYCFAEEELTHYLSLELEMGHLISYHQLAYLNPRFVIQLDQDGVTTQSLLPQAFVDLYLEQVTLRVGKQFMEEGSAHYKNPTGKLMGLDLRGWIPQKIPEGLEAVRLDYSFQEAFILSGVFSWGFSPHLLNEALILEELYQLGVPPPLPIQIAEPSWQGLQDNQYLLRLILPGSKWELSVSGFKGREQYPGIGPQEWERLEEAIQEGRPLSPPLTLHYRKSQGLGLDLITIGEGRSFYLEADFSINTAKEQVWELAMGGIVTLREDLHIQLEIYHRQLLHAPLQIGQEEFLLLHLQKPFFRDHNMGIKGIYNFREKKMAVNPHISLSLGGNMGFTLGGWVEKRLLDTLPVTGERVYLGFTRFF